VTTLRRRPARGKQALLKGINGAFPVAGAFCRIGANMDPLRSRVLEGSDKNETSFRVTRIPRLRSGAGFGY